MGTIKGPITIKKGNIEGFLKSEGYLDIKLPFQATNFRPTKMPMGINLEGVKLHKDAPKPGEEKKFDVKAVGKKEVKIPVMMTAPQQEVKKKTIKNNQKSSSKKLSRKEKSNKK